MTKRFLSLALIAVMMAMLFPVMKKLMSDTKLITVKDGLRRSL